VSLKLALNFQAVVVVVVVVVVRMYSYIKVD